MKAYRILNNKLELSETDIPDCSEEHVIVKVEAIGLNRADLLQIDGLYPAPDGTDIPGIEFSGIRTDTKEPVMGVVPSGAFAHYISVNERNLMPIPRKISLIDAAALPESLLTVWMNLMHFGKLRSHHKVLIHGGSSGIGSMAIQVAKYYGNTVIATVGKEEKIDFCKSIGADYVFNYKEKFFEQVRKIGGADIILDILGAKYFPENIACINRYGKLLVIAFLNGAETTLNLGQVVHKNIRIKGSTLRSRSVKKKYELMEAVIDNLYNPISNRKIRPLIDSYFQFEQIPEAIQKMRNGEHMGKIIIKV